MLAPLSEALALTVGGEAENVNSLDEVPDSAWFTNRLGVHPPDPGELTLGACPPSLLLHPEDSADGTWLIDQGKMNGETPGFRVTIPGKGKFLLKADDKAQPELPTAASVVGAAIYHAVGFNTTCEQIVYFKPSLLRLSPGLRYRHSKVEDPRGFDRKALDGVLSACARRGELVRMSASAWIPGYTLGAFHYDGTRSDDPNDVVPHENRRDLRGGRLVAAWIDHVDARDTNSMDSWFADHGTVPDASPGHVIHYFLDISDAFGPDFGAPQLTDRLGYSYIVDWGDIATDFFTLGIARHPWDSQRGDPAYGLFRYFDVHSFVPDEWKMQYPNPAFSRMTEADGAWMARILAHFTPEMIRALAAMSRFTDPRNTAHLEEVLEGRLEKILDRYLTRLSPIGELRIQDLDRLCGVDLAERRGVRAAGLFRYSARWSRGSPLAVETHRGGDICVPLPHVAGDDGPPGDSAERYVRVTVEDGVARAPLLAYLYDLGPRRGWFIAGVERPAP